MFYKARLSSAQTNLEPQSFPTSLRKEYGMSSRRIIKTSMILQSQLWMTDGLWSPVKSSVTVRTSFRGPSEFCRRVGLGLVFSDRVTDWKLPNSLLVCWYCSDMKRHRGRCKRLVAAIRLQPGTDPDPLWLDRSSASTRNSFFGLQNYKAAKGSVITEKSMFLFSSLPGYSSASSVRSTSTCVQ